MGLWGFPIGGPISKGQAWEIIDRVVVEDCRALKYNEALEVVGKDRLYYSI